jgi:hypothetical protein
MMNSKTLIMLIFTLFIACVSALPTDTAVASSTNSAPIVTKSGISGKWSSAPQNEVFIKPSFSFVPSNQNSTLTPLRLPPPSSPHNHHQRTHLANHARCSVCLRLPVRLHVRSFLRPHWQRRPQKVRHLPQLLNGRRMALHSIQGCFRWHGSKWSSFGHRRLGSWHILEQPLCVGWK